MCAGPGFAWTAGLGTKLFFGEGSLWRSLRILVPAFTGSTSRQLSELLPDRLFRLFAQSAQAGSAPPADGRSDHLDFPTGRPSPAERSPECLDSGASPVASAMRGVADLGCSKIGVGLPAAALFSVRWLARNSSSSALSGILSMFRHRAVWMNLSMPATPLDRLCLELSVVLRCHPPT